jgi:hypothetical protein
MPRFRSSAGDRLIRRFAGAAIVLITFAGSTREASAQVLVETAALGRDSARMAKSLNKVFKASAQSIKSGKVASGKSARARSKVAVGKKKSSSLRKARKAHAKKKTRA